MKILLFVILSFSAFLHPDRVVASSLPQQTINGKVSDSDGMPLPGVNVLIKGSTIGTQTNFDGIFTLEADKGDILVFSFLGMKTKEIPVSSTSNYDIVLEGDSAELEEVVVVGYGTKKRSDVTGSIVSVSSEELNSRPVSNTVEALQGKAAGVDITTNERPGQVGDITIRGVRSLTASNSPLYVVDGIPLITGGIDNLNSNDIESIDILKDASATAIYGSRGANGVVIVTTKRGKNGRFTLNYDGAYTIRTLQDDSELTDAGEYITYRRWAKYYENPEVFPRGDQPTIENDRVIFLGSSDPAAFDNILRGWDGGTWDGSKVRTTNWTDFVTRTGHSVQHTLSASGGTEKLKGYGSFGYINDVGTVLGQSFKRYNGKVSIDIDATDWFTFGTTINTTFSVNEYGQSQTGRNSLVNTSGLYASARANFPYTVPYDADGNRIEYPGGDDAVKTVVDESKYSQDQRVTFRAFASFYSQIDFGEILPALDGLSYRVNFGPDISNYRNGVYIDGKSVVRSGSSYASLSKSQTRSYTLDNLIFYNKDINKHSFGVTLLQSQTEFDTESSSSSAQNIPFPSQKWNALSGENIPELQSYSSDLVERQLLSYMARVNYSYDDKYILTLSGRSDGASQLSEGNKYSFFPSAALGWQVNRESFMENVAWVNQLKLRVGVGVTGNSSIDPYATKGGLSTLFYPYGTDLVSGSLTSTTLANQALGWERTTQYNIGFDFALLQRRITGDIDFYTSRTTDLLLQRSLPSASGYNTTFANVGETSSRGIDLSLTTQNIITDDFSWSSSFSGSYQNNKIVNLANGKEDDINNGWFIGEPQGVIYGYESNGIWQESDAEEIAKFNANGHDFSPGLTRPVDQNGDYIIDANNDRVIIGNTRPKFILGLTNTLNYKNIELSAFIYGRMGYTYNTGGEALTGRFNQRLVDYYTEADPVSEYQKPIYTAGTGDPYSSSLGYRSGSFLKIRNISLGYRLPDRLTEQLKISRCKIYFQVVNPGTIFSKIDWIDLDVGSSSWNRGFTTGINLQF